MKSQSPTCREASEMSVGYAMWHRRLHIRCSLELVRRALYGVGKAPKRSEKSFNHSMFLCSFYPPAWKYNTPLAETPPSITTGRCYHLIAKFRLLWKILPRLSSETSLILFPNKLFHETFTSFLSHGTIWKGFDFPINILIYKCYCFA